MNAYLGLDLGTTSLKALLVGADGQVLHSLSHPLSLYSPKAAWAEQNPAAWIKAAESLFTSIPKKFRIRRIGISGQMHSLVPLDERDQVIRPAILWCDQRTSDQCRRATQLLGGEERVIELVGNPIYEGFTLGKILWLREQEPENYSRIKSFLLPKDYLAFWLTGRKGIEPSDASGTAAFDVRRGCWNAEVLKRLDLAADIFPKVQPSGAVRGVLKKELAQRFGFDEVEVAAGGADNAASALGVGLVEPGDVMVSVGTSGTVAAVTADGRPDSSGRLHFFSHVLPGQNYYMGVMMAAASAVNFFSSKIGREGRDWNWDELTQKAGAVAPGGGGLIYLPYLNGERTPLRDPDARGVLFGLSQQSDWPSIIRAALEGVSFGLRDNFELIREKAEIRKVYLVGGGAKNPLWRRILAANFQEELVVPDVDEGGAYGAAMLAAACDGQALAGLAAWVKPKVVEKPRDNLVRAYENWYPEYKGLYQDLKLRFKRLSEISAE